MGFSPFGRAGTRPSELRFRLGKSLTLQLPFYRAGFYTRRRIFYRRGVKPRPTRLDEPTSDERQPRILVRPVVNPCLSRDVNRQQAAVFVVPRKIVKVANKQVTSERK